MKKFSTLALAAFLLCLRPAFAEGWSSELKANQQTLYSFTSEDSIGLSDAITAEQCGSTSMAWSRGAVGSTAAAELYSCPTGTSPLADCILQYSFTEIMAGAAVLPGMPYLRVNRSALPSAAAAAKLWLFCSQSMASATGPLYPQTQIFALTDYIEQSEIASPTVMFTFPVEANYAYSIQCRFAAFTATTALGVHWSVTGPANSVNFPVFLILNWLGTTNPVENSYNTMGFTQAGTINQGTGTTTRIHKLDGILRPASDGTVDITFNTETDTQYVTVLSGSWCVIINDGPST